MTRFILAATAVVLAAFPALAQPAPSTPPQAAAPADRPAPPPPPIRGAQFRIERPDLQLTVRCADGDTTRACGEIVSQMIEKLAAMPAGKGSGDRTEMRSRDGDRDGSWEPDRDRRDRRYRDRDY